MPTATRIVLGLTFVAALYGLSLSLSPSEYEMPVSPHEPLAPAVMKTTPNLSGDVSTLICASIATASPATVCSTTSGTSWIIHGSE